MRLGATVVPLPDDENGQLSKYHLYKVGMYVRQWSGQLIFFYSINQCHRHSENHNCRCSYVTGMHISNSVNNHQLTGMVISTAVLVCVRCESEGTVVTAHVITCI